MLEPGDNTSGFVLAGKTNRPLKRFFKQEALHLHNNSLARTFILHDDGNNRIAAFLTLVAGEVKVENTPDVKHDGEFRFRYPSYPSIKIARLAVDDEYSGRKLGKSLVEFGLGVAKEYICPIVGCRVVSVDAKRQSVDFYIKCGFKLLDTPENLESDAPFMFIDLRA